MRLAFSLVCFLVFYWVLYDWDCRLEDFLKVVLFVEEVVWFFFFFGRIFSFVLVGVMWREEVLVGFLERGGGWSLVIEDFGVGEFVG